MPVPPSDDAHSAGGVAAGQSKARRVPLSRERVLTAALRLVDAEGLDALTMRRLGQELGRDPMALYRHAKNRAALLDAVAELVLRQLIIPTLVTDWQAQLRSTVHEFRRLALVHPNVVPLLVTRPLATPLGLRPLGTLRPLEQLLTLLTTAGFTPVRALRIYRTFFGLLHGHVLNELQEVLVDPDETDALLRLGLHRLPPESSPSCAASPSTFSRATTAQPSSTRPSTFCSTASSSNRTQPAPATGRGWPERRHQPAAP